MAADVDIEVRIKAARAEATLAKLNAALKITVEREKQAALRTEILTKRLDKAANAGKRAGKGFSTLNIAMSSFIGNITSRAVSAGITTIINGLRGLVDAGREFETGLVAISKTTGLGESATAAFGREIQQISRDLPVATKSLLEIATVAGQLGIKGQENLTAFTETMAKLQLATDIAGTQGSQSVARILTITGELKENGTENINKFGSVITKLGNDFAATEAQILAVATSVAKGTTLFGVASEDVLALATAFKVTGSEAAISGTTIQKVFEKMGRAITEGGDSLKKFAEASDLTEEAFIDLFEKDPTASFARLTEGLGSAGLKGKELSARLSELGFVEDRLRKTLAPLIVQHEVLADAIKKARDEAETKTALDEEAAKAAKTLDSDIIKLSNSFDELGATLFKTLGPILREIVQSMTKFFKLLADNEKLLVTIAASLAAVSIALVVVAFKAAIAAGAFTALAAAAVAMWAAITLPISLAILGFVALGAILFDITDGFSNAKEETRQYKETLDDLDKGFKTLDPDIKDHLNSIGDITGIYRGIPAPLDGAKTALDNLKAPFGDIGKIAVDSAKKVSDAAQTIKLFEQDKTKELKKFFKEEEIDRLRLAFATQKIGEEQIAFTRFVTQEGVRRRSEAFKATIGLDRETIQAERRKQAELKEIRQGEIDFLKFQQTQKEELLRLQQEADIAELQAELFKRDTAIVFEDSEFERLTKNLDRDQQALISAKEDSIANEIDKQFLLAKVRQQAAEADIALTKKTARQKEQSERLLSKTRVGILSDTAGLVNAIAGEETRAGFLISKAAALASVIINTQAGAAQAVAQLGIFAPPAVAAIELQGAIQAATIVATAITGAGNFAEGGIVGGNSFTGDKLQAGVNTGEMILTRQQQSQLFSMANGSGQSTQQEIVTHITVNIDGEEVGNTVSRQVANGLVLGEFQ